MARGSTRTSTIAYLSHATSTLYVSARYRRRVAAIFQVESPRESAWFLPGRGYSVDVREVKGLLQEASEPKVGDERIRTGYKCSIDHPAATKTCTPNSLTSYEYAGYSECAKGASADTCREGFVKIGVYHEWTAGCRSTWADLDVFRWVCLP